MGAKFPRQIEPTFSSGRYPLTRWFKFGDDRLRGLVSVVGEILPFHIDFDSRPYNHSEAETKSRPRVVYHIRLTPYVPPKVKRDFRPKTEPESQSCLG